MTRSDQKILFTALAFLAVVMKEQELDRQDEACKVMSLASLIEIFCLENIRDAMLGLPTARVK